MGLFDKLKKTPEQEAKYQARLAEIRDKREARLARINAAQTERITGVVANEVDHTAQKAAIMEARGNELGSVKMNYLGGYDNPKRHSGKLSFYEKQIEFSQFGQIIDGLVIKASDVRSIEIGGQQQNASRVSLTRMATLGVFSLAAPKRTKIKDTTLTIGLKDGRQAYFHTDILTEFEVHGKLANAISYYQRLAQASQQSVNSSGVSTDDNAREIFKYDALRKRGIITEEEFQAKKKNLLGL